MDGLRARWINHHQTLKRLERHFFPFGIFPLLLSMYPCIMTRRWWACAIILWYLLDSTHVLADKSYWHTPSGRVSLVSLRGGSSAFPTRTPPTIQGRPGQSSSASSLLNPPKTSDPFDTENEDMIEDDASTREMINSFLTRESRNSFIGK